MKSKIEVTAREWQAMLAMEAALRDCRRLLDKVLSRDARDKAPEWWDICLKADNSLATIDVLRRHGAPS